jgi:hypothetical protein
MAVCAYHPDRSAVDRCVECRRDVCADCKTEVAGKPVCTACVEAIRTRVAAEIGVGAAAGTGDSAGGYGSPTAGDPYAAPTGYGTAHAMPNVIVQESPNPARLLAGIALGAAFGAVGAFLLKTFVYYTNFGLSYLNILVGGAVGFGVILGSGRRGPLTAIISAVLAFGAMMFSDYLLWTSVIRDNFGPLVYFGRINVSQFLELQKDQSVMHWVCVAIGVYAAFSLCIDKGTGPAQ